MNTPAYNDYLRSKIEITDLYDKQIITHDQWQKTMESVLLALFNAHPKKAKQEAKILGINNIEWPQRSK